MMLNFQTHFLAPCQQSSELGLALPITFRYLFKINNVYILFLTCAVRCLKTISNDVELPNALPGAMSAMFRIGTGLANRIQVLI